MRYLAILLLASACAAPTYWVRPDTNYTATAADLADCRKGAGSYAVMAQVEQPCMIGKGYHQSTTPPAP